MMRKMIIHGIVLLTCFHLSACEEKYEEEQLNVIVPALVENKTSEQNEVEDVVEENLAEDDSKDKATGDVEHVQIPAIKNTSEKTENLASTPSSTPLKEDSDREKSTGLPLLNEALIQQEGVQKNINPKSSSQPPQQNTDSNQKDIKDSQEDVLKEKKISTPSKPIEVEDPRETVKKKWKDIKNFASRRGFSEDDIKTLVPESLSIENYIKFGEVSTTEEKLNAIEEKLKSIRVSRGYVKQKLNTVLEKVAKGNLSIDEKNDFNLRIKQIEQAIANNEFDRSNRELNEINVDLGQIQSLDNVFEN